MPWKEALEAFADERNWRFGGRFDPNSPNFNGIQTAKDALLVAEDSHDDPTVDMITERLSDHQKNVWMLSSLLEESVAVKKNVAA